MSKRRIADLAFDLVFAWDAGRADEAERAALANAVHEFLSPAPRDINCAVNQGRSGARQFGGGHYLEPRTAERLVEGLRMGLSVRQTMKHAGVSKNSVFRYERLNGPFTCPCGRERKHRGWCKERLKRSPIRRAFLASWFERSVARGARQCSQPRQPIIIEPSIVEKNWPFLSGKPGDGGALIEAVNAIVPRTFEPHARADICQDLLLALLEGEATVENLRDGSAACIKRYHKLHPGKWGPLSLDAPIPGTEGLTLGDTIRDDQPHF